MDEALKKAATAWLIAQTEERKAAREAPKDAAETIEQAFARRYHEAELDREIALLEAIRAIVSRAVAT